MPTAITDLDLDRPLANLRLGSRHDACLLILRVGRRPVGQLRLPLEAGEIDAPALERALVRACGLPVWQAWIERFVGASPPATPVLPGTIAVCTRERPGQLETCLQSLARLPDDGQEILVVDSASRDQETANVVARFPSVRCVRAERPGLDIARNLALESARHELVAFVDDDATVEAEWLRALLAPFAEDDDCLVTTGLVLPAELESPAQEFFERYFGFGRGFEPRIFDRTAVRSEQAWRCGVGASMAMRRGPVLDRLGGFDEALDVGTPTRGGGDNDLFARALAAGFRIHYRPDAVAWHRHGATLGGLHAKFFNYGVSWFAFLRRRAIREGRREAWRELTAGLPRQARRIGRSLLGRPDSIPASLLASELAGWLLGPIADLRSRGASPVPRGDVLERRSESGAPRPIHGDEATGEAGTTPPQLVELDLRAGYAAACRSLETGLAAAALVRSGEAFVGLVVGETESRRLAARDLDLALRGERSFDLLAAWSHNGGLPGALEAPGWTAEALRSWLTGVLAEADGRPDSTYMEHYLAAEDRYRHLQEWIRRQEADKAQLERLERRARADAERAAAEFAGLLPRLHALETRQGELRAQRQALVEQVRARAGVAGR